MTTPTEPQHPDDQQPAQEPDSAQPDAAEVPPQQPESRNAEAARYRTQLRAVEAERDTLAERVATYQRREAEAEIADLLAQPADLWDVGHLDITTVYDDNGDLRADELRAAAGALLEQRPGLRNSGPVYGSALPSHRDWGQHNRRPPGAGATWSDVLNSR